MPLTAILIVLLRIAWRIALCFLIADLLVGLVHWAEDRYFSVDTPWIGQAIIAPNLLHHDQPRAFLAHSWWGSADLQIYAAAVVVGLAALLGWLSMELLLILVLVVNGNEFHKWAHRTRAENGWLINALHDAGLFQGRKHHALHHGRDRDTHYCTITAWVNPLCERLGLWRGLEWLIARVVGVPPRLDPAVVARRAKAV